VTLVLIALAVGGGLSLVSPWAGEGVSATTVSVLAGIGLICMAVVASTLGGYITGRLRSAWDDVHQDERYFRDTAHGFVTWAFATALTASVLAGAATHLLAAASTGAIPAAGAGAAQATSTSAGDVYVDRLLRPNNPSGQQQGSAADTRAELLRVLAPVTRSGGQIADADRTYAAQVVAARTGLSREDAQRRVDQIVTEAKAAADAARKAARNAALWAAAAMLAGALASALAAAAGGQMRNARWYELTPTTITTVRSV
jgi:hypothetical protein